MKRLRSLLVIMLAGMALTWPIVPTVPALADAKSDVCQGIGFSTGGCGDSGTQVNNVIDAVVLVLSIIIGVVATIMIIISGFRFITSGGDATNVAKAKNGIIYALIGLAIVATAQLITHFVLSRL